MCQDSKGLVALLAVVFALNVHLQLTSQRARRGMSLVRSHCRRRTIAWCGGHLADCVVWWASQLTVWCGGQASWPCGVMRQWVCGVLGQLLKPSLSAVTLYKTMATADKCVCYYVLILSRTVCIGLTCERECESLMVMSTFWHCPLPVCKKLLKTCSLPLRYTAKDMSGTKGTCIPLPFFIPVHRIALSV